MKLGPGACLAIAAVVCSVTGASANPASLLASIPASRELSFSAKIDGTPLGTHKVNFSTEGARLIVSTEIDLSSDLLFIRVYEYKHRGKEIWENGQLTRFASETDDNGTPHNVDMRTNGPTSEITASGYSGAVSGSLSPTSYWSYAAIQSKRWLNTQDGRVINVNITPAAEEQLQIQGKTVLARRYEVTGDLTKTLWYDRAGRWIKSRFVYDGQTIDYELTTPLQSAAVQQ